MIVYEATKTEFLRDNNDRDIEDVILERVDGAFSDFDLAWTLVDETCASVGLASVTLSFQRFGQAVPEDAFTVDCVAASVLRRTFVPGSYDVSVAGIGGGDVTYIGTQTVDLPPGSVAEVDVVLAPVG